MKLIRKVKANCFLSGESGWRANIDWFLRGEGRKGPATHVRLAEGEFDEKGAAPQVQVVQF